MDEERNENQGQNDQNNTQDHNLNLKSIDEIRQEEHKRDQKFKLSIDTNATTSSPVDVDKSKENEEGGTEEEHEHEKDNTEEQEQIASEIENNIKRKPIFKLKGVYQPKGERWGKTAAELDLQDKKDHPYKYRIKKTALFIGELLLDALIVLVVVVFIRIFIVSPFQVDGHSMDNTFHDKDFILVDEISYRFSSPERGDIIVFKPPTDDNVTVQDGIICSAKKLFANIKGDDPKDACMVSQYFIKRVIGTPGDIIEIKAGKVYITPKYSDEQIELKENYLSAENKGSTCLTLSNSCATTLDMEGKIYEVPDDSYFVLGDNRRGSSDSRHWKNDGKAVPYVPFDNIRGKVRLTVWPISEFSRIEEVNY